VAGFSVLAFGVALVFLPRPAIVVVPLGLAILATEFRWAGRLVEPIRRLLRRLEMRVRGAFGGTVTACPPQGPAMGRPGSAGRAKTETQATPFAGGTRGHKGLIRVARPPAP